MPQRSSADSLEQQSRVALLARKLLDGDAAIQFLHVHHDALSARPLDLAVASPIGRAAVEQAITVRR